MGMYEEFINNILNNRGRFACGDEYHERHHIIPRCIGGGNDEENLIDLFAREHFEAHRLLALENPDNDKLIYAWWCISTMKNEFEERYNIIAEEYEELRVSFSKAHSNAMRGSGNPNFQKKLSDETINKIKNTLSGKNCGESNHRYGQHHTEEAKEAISLRLKEKFKNKEIHPMYGRTGKDNKKSKIINQYNGDVFVQTWYGSREIERNTGISQSNIIGCCKHKPRYKTAGGFRWFYADDPEQPDKSHIIQN